MYSFKPFLEGGSTQQRYFSPWPVLVTLLNWLLLASLPCIRSHVIFIYMLSTLRTTLWDIKDTCPLYLLSYPCLSSLSGYQYLEFFPWASKLMVTTTEPVRSALYISMSLSHVLSQISISLLIPWYRLMLFINGFTVPLLITEASLLCI